MEKNKINKDMRILIVFILQITLRWRAEQAASCLLYVLAITPLFFFFFFFFSKELGIPLSLPLKEANVRQTSPVLPYTPKRDDLLIWGSAVVVLRRCDSGQNFTKFWPNLPGSAVLPTMMPLYDPIEKNDVCGKAEALCFPGFVLRVVTAGAHAAAATRDPYCRSELGSPAAATLLWGGHQMRHVSGLGLAGQGVRPRPHH
jgi:hypothetical protein